MNQKGIHELVQRYKKFPPDGEIPIGDLEMMKGFFGKIPLRTLVQGGYFMAESESAAPNIELDHKLKFKMIEILFDVDHGLMRRLGFKRIGRMRVKKETSPIIGARPNLPA